MMLLFRYLSPSPDSSMSTRPIRWCPWHTFTQGAKIYRHLPIPFGASGVSASDGQWGQVGRIPAVGRWVRTDRRYNQPYRLTGYAGRAIIKWISLIVALPFVNAWLAGVHLGALILVTTGGLIWYAVHCIRRSWKQRTAEAAPKSVTPPAIQVRFNAPPNWPSPPLGWSPEPGWQPDPSWPPSPPGWQFWVPLAAPTRGARGERNSRVIPQDVKITVSLRDQGKCVQCGATEDLHFDHKIPWSRGGTNTVNNIQLLCGLCNRRKGAADGLP